MPIFDYLCPRCNDVKEQRVNRAEDTVLCDRCNAVMTKQMTGGYKIRPSNYANLRTGKRYT